MRVNPYLHFKGNCSEALAFYEEAFGVKGEISGRYKDAPSSEGYQAPPEMADWIMHAQFTLGDTVVMLSDGPTEGEYAYNGFSISVTFDSVEDAKAVFEKFREGGIVEQELAETFWSKAWGMVTDKFGVNWQFTV
ncbi:MAG: VOC family protein [Pseudomonadales bacterium]|jgi:PhnB protein|nr:VOC family protein [Pseudomonadales bacterium]